MNIKNSVDLIKSYLDLDRKPVGIKFFFDKDEFDNFEIPQRNSKVTYCNSVQLASKGSAMKLTKDNQGCPNGAMVLKMKEVPIEDYKEDLDVVVMVSSSYNIMRMNQLVKRVPIPAILLVLLLAKIIKYPGIGTVKN